MTDARPPAPRFVDPYYADMRITFEKIHAFDRHGVVYLPKPNRPPVAWVDETADPMGLDGGCEQLLLRRVAAWVTPVGWWEWPVYVDAKGRCIAGPREFKGRPFDPDEVARWAETQPGWEFEITGQRVSVVVETESESIGHTQSAHGPWNRNSLRNAITNVMQRATSDLIFKEYEW